MSVNYVGKYKIAPRKDDGTHTWGGSSLPAESSAIPTRERTGLARTTAETLYFQLKEFDEFRQPSFNVLYVETPRPEWKRNPLMEQLSGVVAETAEMLAPLSRLLIPKNSLRDKLPYFREDFSPLPNNVRPRVQKVLRSNVEFAEQQSKLAQAADEYMKAKREGKDVPIPPELLKAGRQHTPHFPEPHFITGEMPSWVVPALNISAYIYLCGFWGIGKDLFK